MYRNLPGPINGPAASASTPPDYAVDFDVSDQITGVFGYTSPNVGQIRGMGFYMASGKQYGMYGITGEAYFSTGAIYGIFGSLLKDAGATNRIWSLGFWIDPPQMPPAPPAQPPPPFQSPPPPSPAGRPRPPARPPPPNLSRIQTQLFGYPGPSELTPVDDGPLHPGNASVLRYLQHIRSVHAGRLCETNGLPSVPLCLSSSVRKRRMLAPRLCVHRV